MMDISLKDTQIAGYWATARKNTLDDCVSELHYFMTSLESLYPGGHWCIMREAPQRLGANVENSTPGLTDLLLGQLEGAKTPDADASFGYYFNLEYLGPLPIIVQGCVGIQTDNKNFKNFVLIKFWRDPEVPESSQGELTLEAGHQLLEAIIRCWSPHLATWTTTAWLRAVPKREAYTPSLGWKTYFSEPAVCELISDLGKPLHQGILLETATDIHDVTPEKIAALAQELADRGVEDTLYRGA